MSQTHYPLVIPGVRQWVTRTEGSEGETESKREREGYRETQTVTEKEKDTYSEGEKERGTKRERWAYE